MENVLNKFFFRGCVIWVSILLGMFFWYKYWEWFAVGKLGFEHFNDAQILMSCLITSFIPDLFRKDNINTPVVESNIHMIYLWFALFYVVGLNIGFWVFNFSLR